MTSKVSEAILSYVTYLENRLSIVSDFDAKRKEFESNIASCKAAIADEVRAKQLHNTCSLAVMPITDTKKTYVQLMDSVRKTNDEVAKLQTILANVEAEWKVLSEAHEKALEMMDGNWTKTKLEVIAAWTAAFQDGIDGKCNVWYFNEDRRPVSVKVCKVSDPVCTSSKYWSAVVDGKTFRCATSEYLGNSFFAGTGEFRDWPVFLPCLVGLTMAQERILLRSMLGALHFVS